MRGVYRDLAAGRRNLDTRIAPSRRKVTIGIQIRWSGTFRNAQQSVVALDIIALMDALKIEKAILAGYDWGARTADIIAALWPERCAGLVSVNGYLINNLERNKLPLPPKAEWGWWYQYYFATERGRAGLDANRRDFAKLI